MMNTNEKKRRPDRRRKRLRRSALAALLSVAFVPWLLVCSPPEGPVDFEVGEKKCDHCNMGIADLRFRGEAITKKGKVHTFDSIECLLAWDQEHSGPIHSRWVADFSNPGVWLPLDSARFLQSQQLRSPMGAGLSAYPDEASLKAARERVGGRELAGAELKGFIEKWRAAPGGTMRP